MGLVRPQWSLWLRFEPHKLTIQLLVNWIFPEPPFPHLQSGVGNPPLSLPRVLNKFIAPKQLLFHSTKIWGQPDVPGSELETFFCPLPGCAGGNGFGATATRTNAQDKVSVSGGPRAYAARWRKPPLGGLGLCSLPAQWLSWVMGLWTSHQAATKTGKAAANSLKVNPQPVLHQQVPVWPRFRMENSSRFQGLRAWGQGLGRAEGRGTRM